MTTTTEGRDLILTRTIDAPREKVYRAWTDPALLKQWFAPLPWTTPSAELNVFPGGANVIVMRGPDGVEFPNRGIYLDVVPNQRLVFTDAYTSAWEPSRETVHDGDPDVRGRRQRKDQLHRARAPLDDCRSGGT